MSRRALAAVVSLLALVTGACARPGSNTNRSTTKLTSYQLVSASVDKTTAQKTAHMSLTMHLEGLGGGQSFDITSTGSVDLANHDAAMSFDMSGGQMSMHMDMVLVDGALYMHLPRQLATQVPSGKSWMKIDIAALARSTGLSIPGLSGGSMGAFDPAQQLDYLRGVSRSVTLVGSDTVDGASTERFHIVIDLQKALSKLTGNAKCGLSAVMKSLGDVTIPADVWIDDQGRLRQMRMSLDLPGTNGASMTMQMKLFDFGAHVDISAPPAQEVYDITPQVSSHLPSCVTSA